MRRRVRQGASCLKLSKTADSSCSKQRLRGYPVRDLTEEATAMRYCRSNSQNSEKQIIMRPSPCTLYKPAQRSQNVFPNTVVSLQSSQLVIIPYLRTNILLNSRTLHPLLRQSTVRYPIVPHSWPNLERFSHQRPPR